MRIRDPFLHLKARMGWVDTKAERVLWCVIRSVTRTRRAGLLAVLALGASPALIPQAAVVDNANLQNHIYQFSAQGIRDQIGRLWTDVRQDSRWVTDLVETYRTVKMARTAYESLATFDLTQNVNVVDLIPQIDLVEGQYFGGEDTGFSSTDKENRYVSLRFKLNPSGGIAKTLNFSTLAKFKPKLRINVDELATQLANLDFDAVQMVQYRGPGGEMKGSPVEVGRSVGLRLALWDDILKTANDFVGQRQKEQDSYRSLQDLIAAENMTFNQSVRNLQDRAQKADDELRQRLAGLDVPADIPATYDMIYSPRVQLARRVLEAEQAAHKQELAAFWKKLGDLKKTEEKRQAAVQGDAQVTEILAEAAKIQQDIQVAFNRILEKYKVKRKDGGEKVGGGLLPMLSLSSKDMEEMKLPPQAQEEAMRMLQAGSQALAVLQIKLQGQKYMAENLSTIDGVTRDLTDATNALSGAYQNRASTELQTVAANVKKLDGMYLDQWRALEDRNRQEAAQNTQQIWDSFGDANRKYFQYMLTKKPMSAGALLQNLASTYVSFLKSFAGKRSLGDVMGSRNEKVIAEYQQEADLYKNM